MLRNNGRHNFRSPYGVQPSLILDFAGTGTLDSRITFTRSTTARYYNSSGILTTAAINEARFDYNPSTLAPLGLLIEQSSTNLLLQSQTFDNAYWTKANTTISADATTAPDGTQTGDALIESISLSAHQIYRVSLGTANTYTFTMYAQPKGRTQIQIEQESGGNSRFTLTGNGTALALGANTVSIANVGNGWYRCSTTFTTTAAFGIYIGLYNGGISYLGDGTSGAYIWGAQLETLAFPTSYIPTTTAQVTRGSDNPSMIGSDFTSWWNSSQGTFYISATYQSYLATRVSRPYLLFLIDSGFNRLSIRGVGDGGAGNPSSGIIGNNSSNKTLNSPSISALEKLTLSYSNVDSYLYNNGIASANNPGLNFIYGGQTTLYLGSNNTTNQFGGWLSKIAFYPQALTSAQLIALTT